MEKVPIKFLIKNGFLHIVTSSVLNKILQFCSGVIIIRFLSKEDYGRYSYAGNILSLFLLVEGLGVCSGLLQYACECNSPQKKIGYVKLSVLYGGVFDAVLGLAVLVFSLLFELPVSGSVEILRYLFLIPVLNLFFNIAETYLRASLKNFEYSALSVTNTVLTLVGSVTGVILYGVWGVICGRYIAYFVTDVLAFVVMRKDFFSMKFIRLPEKKERHEFLSYSVVAMLSNSISGLLYLIDTFLVGLIIKESIVVAAYKTATTIPFALNFIPQAVMTFAYPYFAKINSDKSKFKKYYSSLIGYMALFNIFISGILFVFAPWIIKIVFGNNYSDSVLPFRILSVGYFFAGTFRIPAGNMIAALKKIKMNLYNSLISGILNIVFDILFILWWGSNGAAISTTCIYIISALIANGYMYYYLNKRA